MPNLLGKVIIKATLEAKTGLRVGGSSSGLKIGGVDLNVITDPEGKPYIPGSSLKGKMRSLLERNKNVEYNDNQNRMHLCRTDDSYAECPVCRIFGTLSDKGSKSVMLTRLYCRDAFLDKNSITDAMRNNMDLFWTEVKYETAIDRKKGAALQGSLRQIERVPAGTCFETEFVFNIYEEADQNLLKDFFVAMSLLEDDYLGGMGSRGYGQIEFSQLKIWWNSASDYEKGTTQRDDSRKLPMDITRPKDAIAHFDDLKNQLRG